jgi:hypothetical protein
MRSPLLLRIAAIVFLLYTAGHTFGAMFKDPSTGGLEKQAVLAAMRSYHQDIGGFSRSYWDFYKGFGFYVSLGLLSYAILCWQLADLSRTSPSAARPLVMTLFVLSIPMTILAWTNFFILPFVLSLVGMLLLGVAAFRLPN